MILGLLRDIGSQLIYGDDGGLSYVFDEDEIERITELLEGAVDPPGFSSPSPQSPEEWREKAKKLLLSGKKGGFDAVHDMLYTESKHTDLMREIKDKRNLRVLIPYYFCGELTLDDIPVIGAIKRFYDMGAEIHILWMDDHSEKDFQPPEWIESELDILQRLIDRRRGRQRGKDRGSIAYVRETALRKLMDENPILKELRRDAFNDLLLHRKPKRMRNNTELTHTLETSGGQIHSTITIQLFNVYREMVQNIEPFDITFRDWNGLIYDLECRRSLKEKSIRWAPFGYMLDASEDNRFDDILYISPIKKLETIERVINSAIAHNVLHEDDYEKGWRIEELIEGMDEGVRQLSRWVGRDENVTLRHDLTAKVRTIYEDYKSIWEAVREGKGEWVVNFDVGESSELPRRLRLFFPDKQLEDFENMAQYLIRIKKLMESKGVEWVELTDNRVISGDVDKHERMVRKLKDFGVGAQKEFERENELQTTDAIGTDDVVICNNSLYAIRKKKGVRGSPLEIHVKEEALKLCYNWMVSLESS